jgi:hypothetical protein
MQSLGCPYSNFWSQVLLMKGLLFFVLGLNIYIIHKSRSTVHFTQKNRRMYSALFLLLITTYTVYAGVPTVYIPEAEFLCRTINFLNISGNPAPAPPIPLSKVLPNPLPPASGHPSPCHGERRPQAGLGVGRPPPATYLLAFFYYF